MPESATPLIMRVPAVHFLCKSYKYYKSYITRSGLLDGAGPLVNNAGKGKNLLYSFTGITENLPGGIYYSNRLEQDLQRYVRFWTDVCREQQALFFTGLTEQFIHAA
jgi:hypothetical protein